MCLQIDPFTNVFFVRNLFRDKLLTEIFMEHNENIVTKHLFNLFLPQFKYLY